MGRARQKKVPSPIRGKEPSRPSTIESAGGISDNQQLILSILLIVITFIAFYPTTQSEFINFDDGEYVSENKNIQEGVTTRGIVWAFTTGRAGNWHPLTWLSHMIDVQIFGLKPGWHHLTNLLFHITNAVLLFFTLFRMTKALWPSALVAALFALHPLHVESVAWVAERKDVLSTFFWMLTIFFYITYVFRPGLTRYLAVICCFALGLMAKPMLVSLPLVLLLLDYWPLNRLVAKEPSREIRPLPKIGMKKGVSPSSEEINKLPHIKWPLIYALLLEKIPLFLLAMLSSVVTYLAQSQGGAVSSLQALSLGARVANALTAYTAYIIKMVWPLNLAVLYPHPGSWPLWQVLGSVLFLILVTVLVFRGGKRYPYGVVGWLWYVITLGPVIGIIQVGSHFMADRYTYVPLIGLFILVAWGANELLQPWPYRKQTLTVLSVLCLLCLAFLTWRQAGYWRNSITLYNHTLEVTDNNSIIYSNRGLAYSDNRGDYAKAIEDFTRAIEISPDLTKTYNNRGIAFGKLGNFQEAIRDFDKAIDLDPQYFAAYNERGLVNGKTGNFQEAIKDFDKAIALNPRFAAAYNNRALAYGNLGDFQEAIKDFDKAIKLEPKASKVYVARGLVYDKLKEDEQAIRDFKIAARMGEKRAQDFLREKGESW
jgi:protein O-mannosyl-transferase